MQTVSRGLVMVLLALAALVGVAPAASATVLPPLPVVAAFLSCTTVAIAPPQQAQRPKVGTSENELDDPGEQRPPVNREKCYSDYRAALRAADEAFDACYGTYYSYCAQDYESDRFNAKMVYLACMYPPWAWGTRRGTFFLTPDFEFPDVPDTRIYRP